MKIDYDRYFTEDNVYNVRKKMEGYLMELFAQELYLKNQKREEELYDSIFLNNSPDIDREDLFSEYENLIYEDNIMENWLAYQIGFELGRKKGLREKKENSRLI